MATVPVYMVVDDEVLIPGPSAYAVAVSNGFVGTEAQWLASLQGEAVGDWRYSPISGNNTTVFNEFLADAVAAGVRIGLWPAEWSLQPHQRRTVM